LGFICMRDRRLEEAEQEFRAAIAIDPQYADAQIGLGLLLAGQGRDQAAIALLRQAIESKPDSTQAYVSLGLLLAGQTKYAEAEQQLEQAARIAPEDPQVLSTLGVVQSNLGSPERSARTFEKLVTLQPAS